MFLCVLPPPCFTPERLVTTSSMQRRPTVRLSVSVCASPSVSFQCVPGDLLCTRYSPFLCPLSPPPPVHLRSPLSISPRLHPAPPPPPPPPPVRYHSYIFLSISIPSVATSSFPSSIAPSFISCWLFIRGVNNCLPTVIIAPRCQPAA